MRAKPFNPQEKSKKLLGNRKSLDCSAPRDDIADA
jgi:hypothetical protein